MIVDIFSSFDPATRSLFNFSPIRFWALNLRILIIIHPSLWLNSRRQPLALISISSIIYEQNSRSFSHHLKGFGTLLVRLFLIIIFTNFIGMLPYVFRNSCQLIFTFSFGLPLWLSLILSGASYSPSTAAASLLPGGAPAWLNPFLVLIETTRIIFRPVTLSFRLAANITAGHIILTLVGVYLIVSIFTLSPPFSILLFLIQTGYTLFEFGICLIQAYIFCLLLSLYRDDHPSHC